MDVCEVPMHVILFFLLLNSTVLAATPEVEQTYTALNKVFNIDRNLRSKVSTAAIQSKMFDFTKGSLTAEQQQKLDHGYDYLKKDWSTQFEKKFTKKEIAYIKTLFSHPLLVRLIKFEDEFLKPDEKKDKLLIAEVIKEVPKETPAKKK